MNTNGDVTWVDAIEEAEGVTEFATEYVTSEENDYTITFAGLANGTYTLIEKTVPTGYNPLAENPTVTITDANKTDGGAVQVENNTGTELPSTGGMGTTVFYIIGAVLMLGAVVVLVSRKRMAA